MLTDAENGYRSPDLKMQNARVVAARSQNDLKTPEATQ